MKSANHFEILFTDSDYNIVSKAHEPQVADDLKKKIQEKNKQLKWATDFSQVSQRFHNRFGNSPLQVVELKFTSCRRYYRALLLVVDEAAAKKLVFHKVVMKETSYQGSRQCREIGKLLDSPGEYLDRAKDKVLAHL